MFNAKVRKKWQIMTKFISILAEVREFVVTFSPQPSEAYNSSSIASHFLWLLCFFSINFVRQNIYYIFHVSHFLRNFAQLI